MDNDLIALLKTQSALNPWLVVLLGAISGLLAFALSNAMQVVRLRHRRVARDSQHPFVVRLRQGLKITGLILAAAWGIQAIDGPKMVDDEGWLSGEGLFTVSNRPGFLASYPNANRTIKMGDVVLQLLRQNQPDEVAATMNRRALLAQDLAFARLETLRVDPLLLSEYSAAVDRLHSLESQEKRLQESHNTQLLEAPRQQMQDRAQLDKVIENLRAAESEAKRVDANLKTANQNFDTLTKRLMPNGMVELAGNKLQNHRTVVAELQARQSELRERIALLSGQEQRLQAMSSTATEAYRSQMKVLDNQLSDAAQLIGKAEEDVENAHRRVEDDKQRAELQRQSRIRQIQVQIDSLDGIDTREGMLDVRAPWDGLVGFREPSPASIGVGSRPLLVLYQPGKVFVRVETPSRQAALAMKDHAGIELQALIRETSTSKFPGTLMRTKDLPNGGVELQIACDPPARAIRELAMGNSVPVHVAIRRLNPLTMGGGSWAWMAMGSLPLGFVLGEVRLRNRSRRATRSSSLVPESARIDWGGDPDEFIEYIDEIGIVPRKMRQVHSKVNPIDEKRAPREVKATKLRADMK